MNNRPTFWTILFVLLLGTSSTVSSAEQATRHPTRNFVLRYAATLGDIGDREAHVWIPVPSSNAAQDVKIVTKSLPANAKETTEKKYGNRMLYFTIPNASANRSFSVEYGISRREVRALNETQSGETKHASSSLTDLSAFLQPNANVPITGKPISLLPLVGKDHNNVERARTIYNRVDELVKYDKSKPGYGNGDVLWVCDSRTGNCTDFHSLFISMARSQSIPAKFEIGFPLPTNSTGQPAHGKIGGYHCWASFMHNGRWIPVDISEADKHPEMKEYYFGNLTKDRVAFSTGRDIVLEPPQNGPPLNYFVYPYVEVDGKPLSKEHIQLDFSYRDTPVDAANATKVRTK